MVRPNTLFGQKHPAKYDNASALQHDAERIRHLIVLRPLRRTGATTSCLNSAVNFRRCLLIEHLLRLIMPSRCPQNEGKFTFYASITSVMRG